LFFNILSKSQKWKYEVKMKYEKFLCH
jgi:hypothetical protein